MQAALFEQPALILDDILHDKRADGVIALSVLQQIDRIGATARHLQID